MRKTASYKTIFGIAVMICFLFSCSDKTEWKTFSSKEGGFSALFPGTPTDTTFLGGVSLQHETFKRFYGEEQNSYYKVNYINLPQLDNPVTGGKMDACELSKGYNKLDMESYAMQLGGSLRESITRVTVSGVEAEEFKVDFSDKSGVVTVRKLCSNGRSYTLMVITRSNAENNEEVAKFFNSFKLNGK